ncbi:hypothetical protein CapIbe_007126 [Capra ibex]
MPVEVLLLLSQGLAVHWPEPPGGSTYIKAGKEGEVLGLQPACLERRALKRVTSSLPGTRMVKVLEGVRSLKVRREALLRGPVWKKPVSLFRFIQIKNHIVSTTMWQALS